MHRQSRTKPEVGKYILDAISIGMYNNPLMVLREYIQNSTDSIDEFKKNIGFDIKQPRIEISIDGVLRSLTIKDNGAGVPSKIASSVLHNLGKSLKMASLNRGFRGIGRLGGLGYCDELKFITKAKGESIYSISQWDCKKLREFINHDCELLDASALIRKVVEFSQHKYENSSKDHFFIVEMNRVRSSKDILLDVPAIKSYLSQVAPVPFDIKKFSLAEKIDKALRDRVPFYDTYAIFVNDEQIFKPYKDEIRISQENIDRIKQIELKQFENRNGLLAFGWIADLQFLGIISSSDLVDGIRLRSGNILIGDKGILSDFFRESRFNNYLVGEIHIVDPRLILNSRRDDFEDNYYKEEFYNVFVKEIGIPMSQKIRKASEQRSELRKFNRYRQLIKESQDIAKHGYLSTAHYKNVLKNLKQTCDELKKSFEFKAVDALVNEINQAEHRLDKVHNINIRKNELKTIFDMIYKNCSNKIEGLEIIKQTLTFLDK
ncbi:MAG TPA: ATP-binding protein [Candidatus Tripitaka californicus]